MRSFKKTLRVSIASIFIVVGALGIVLPFINGILFMLAGLLVLSLESPTLEAWLDRHGRKHHRIERWYDRCKNFVHKYF